MIEFNKIELEANFSDAAGEPLQRTQQVRTDPITSRQCRITPSRSLENERGTEKLHQPPDMDLDESNCPFCPANLELMTHCLKSTISKEQRLNRNAYNLSLLSIEDGQNILCLKVALTARSSYAPWVRSDFTGFEIASGEMATFTLPESVARMAQPFWGNGPL